MSSRTSLRPYYVMTNASMAASITSSVSILQSLTSLSYGVSWAGGATPVGTLSVEVSNDYTLDSAGAAGNAGTWTALTLNVNGVLSTTVAVSGNSGTVFIDIEKTAAYAARLIYTRASGTGTMNATVVGKVS